MTPATSCSALHVRRRTAPRARAFSLIEAVAVVVVLSLVVPPSLMWMNDAAARRADAVATLRATTLATAVVETIMADAVSNAPGLGFAALGNSITYIDAPAAGLRSRLAPVSGLYESMGMTHGVVVGPLVDATGSVNANLDANLFRIVTVRVDYPSAEGPALTVTVPFMVASP